MGKGFVEYSVNVGKILANLQALEFLIRDFLYAMADTPFSPLLRPLNELKLGDVAPTNPFTDWSSLRELIDRYNRRVGSTRAELVVDGHIVAVRDALAHGRMWLPNWPAEPEASPLLLKFAKPRGDCAAVEFVQVASDDWLEATITAVSAEIEKVNTARHEL